MPNGPLKRLVILLIVWTLTVPPMTAMHSDAGSVIDHAPSDFANGTEKGTLVIPDGVKLGVEKEYLNNWTMLDDGHPGAKFRASLEYDEAKDEYIIFGFDWTWGGYMETYTYNTTTDEWTNLYPFLKYYPPNAWESGTLRYSVAYDSLNSEGIVFGGWEGETWIFNTTEASWTRKMPVGSPSPRYSFEMAFDTVYGEAILFGGHEPIVGWSEEPAPHFNDTWTYIPRTNTWTNRTPVVSPPGLCNHKLAYDRANGETILFGGRITDAVNETWAYNRSTNTWTNMSPVNAPSPRQRHSMVYDSGKGRMVMFGGDTPDYNNETWAYNFSDNTWTNITMEYSPLPRLGHAMAYDSRNSQILVYGGRLYPSTDVGESQNADVWIYDEATDKWSVRPAKTPIPSVEYDMAFDPITGEVVLKSEYFYSGGPETWSYNLSTNKWKNLNPYGTTPSSIGNGMVYDRVCGTMVVNGYGPGPQTWMFNHSNNTWIQMNPIAPIPTRERGAMSYDVRAERTVLFGGYLYLYSMEASNETWTYDSRNNTWTNRTPSISPSARICSVISYIDSTSEILLFGGASDWRYGICYNDTWKYNYTTNNWTNLTKPNGPSLYSSFSSSNTMVYNAKRNEVLLTLGASTWIFDVSTNDWTQINTATTHRSGYGCTLVYDSINDETVLFGGCSYDGWLGETWAFNHRVLFKEGNHTSVPIDTGGPSHFGILNLSADVPEGTGLRIQLRSADTKASLSSMPFIGPDGTNLTYYNTSGQAISDDHSNRRWIQYRAYLNTTYDLLSPVLKSVNITYNLLPEMPILNAPSNGEWTNTSRPTFSWTSQDNDSSINGFEWQIDDSSLFDSVDHSSGQILSSDLIYQPAAPIADGTWYWRVRTLDSDGDWGPFSGSRVLRVDTGPPESFQPVVDPPEWTNETIQLAFNTTDSAVGMGHYEVDIDGVSQGTQASPFTLPVLSDGEHKITVKAFDLLWNNISAVVKVYQDRTPPLAFAPTAEPSGWSNSSPLILFNTSDETSGIAHYEVSLDRSEFAEQQSPYQLPDLAEGQHNVMVRAYDAAGNYRDALISVSIDKTKPFNFTITSDFTGWTNRNPNIYFQAVDNLSSIDHFEVKLPGGNFTAQPSPYRVPDLPDGRHNITIRAYDKATNYAEAIVELFVDRAPPANFTPVASPATWTNQDPNITFFTVDNTSGISRYEVGLAGGNISTRTSPFRFTSLPEGQQQVVVRAYDAAGNYAEGTVPVYIDRTPPNQIFLKINDGEKSTGKTKVTLSVLATDALSDLGSVCFSNDGIFYSGWEPFTNTKDWNLSKDQGGKTVYIKVKDKAGNVADPVMATIKYSPSASEGGSLLMTALLLLILIVVAATVAVGWRASKKKKPEASAEEPPTKAPEETPLGPAEGDAPPAEPEEEPEPPTAELLTEPLAAPTEVAAPAVPAKEAAPAIPPVEAVPAVTVKTAAPSAPQDRAPSLAPAAAIPATTAIAPEGFAVEDLFLTYRDGRLIQHTTRRLKADMDVDIMTSMLSAVQEFIKESF